MGTIDPPIPDLGVVGSQPATDIVDALEEIRDEINGGLDNDNLAAKGIRADKWPYAFPVVSSNSPGYSMVGGPVLPDLTDFVYGEQLITAGGLPDMPSYPSCRQVQIGLRYRKSQQFSGGNATDNELLLRLGAKNVFGQSSSLYATIPGSTGVVANQTAYITEVGSSPGTGSLSTVGGFLTTFYTLDQLYLTGEVYARATGPDGPFDGSFTIHEIVIRYRDLEFS